MTDSHPKYPDCTVQLSGGDGNAVAIFMKVARELRRHLMDVQDMGYAEADQEAEAFKTEATSSDYDNVLTTCHRWVNVV